MRLDFGLNITQEQKLIMTQQMQLSIKLLQMSTYDLKDYIENEFVENPILEGDFDFVQEEKGYQDKLNYKEIVKYLDFDNYGSQNYGSQSCGDYKEDNISPFTFISKKQSLTEYLKGQLIETEEEEYIKSIVLYMIENLDGKGYLEVPLSYISCKLKVSEEEAEKALNILQDFEPNGIGARSLEECLKIQLIRYGRLTEELEEIIDNHLDLIAENKFVNLGKILKIEAKEAQGLGDIIKTLEAKPSRGFYTGEEIKFIIPDATIRKIDGQYYVVMNDGIIPKLSISSLYKDIINNSTDKKMETYVKEKLNGAIFLIKSIEQRKSTLLKILEKIVEKQQEYFENGNEYLKPMTLKDVAEEIGMHESTVSRDIKDKYILTNIGTVKIKDLFTSGLTKTSFEESIDISVINIKNQIKEIIDNEDKKKTLSDQKICGILNEKDFNISRRTVTKYREELGIRSSSKRRRL